MKKNNLSDYLKDYNQYFKGITIEGNNTFVTVLFEDDWQVISSSNKNIKCTASKKANGEWFFYGETDKVSIDDIMETIKENIRFNKELYNRNLIFEKKKKELAKIISEAPIKKLETLDFCFRKKKKINDKESSVEAIKSTDDKVSVEKDEVVTNDKTIVTDNKEEISK